MNLDEFPNDPDIHDPVVIRFANKAAADVLELAAVAAACPGDMEALETVYERLIPEEDADDHVWLLLGAAVGLLGDIVRHLECPHQSVGDVVTRVRARAAELRGET